MLLRWLMKAFCQFSDGLEERGDAEYMLFCKSFIAILVYAHFLPMFRTHEAYEAATAFTKHPSVLYVCYMLVIVLVLVCVCVRV